MNMPAEKKHSKRIPEIEIMKVTAIIAMVFVHVYEVSMGSLDFSTKGPVIFATLIEFFGCIPSAGVFMFAMGWGVAFSKTTPESYFTRFLYLFALGLFVNIFQQWVPCILDPENFGALKDNLHTLIAVDIYAFSALATLYSMTVKKLEGKPRAGILVGVLLVAVTFWINITFGYETFSTGNEWADTFIGLFIRENEYSYFPYISWIVFPVAGFGAGYLYKKLDDKKKFILIAVCAGIVQIIFGLWMMQQLGMEDTVLFRKYDVEESLYYGMHPVYAVCGLGMIAVEFAISTWILKLTKERIPSFMTEMSKNVMDIYVIQWMIIGCISPVLVRLKSIYVNMAVSVLILIAAFFASKVLEAWKADKNVIREKWKGWEF